MVFAALPVGKGEIVIYYYGLLVCEYLSFSGTHFKTFEESVVKVTIDTFMKWMSRIPETATDRHIVQHSVWKVPAPFCAIRYVENRRYL